MPTQTCPRCHGAKTIIVMDDPEDPYSVEKCPHCDGEGVMADLKFQDLLTLYHSEYFEQAQPEETATRS